MTDGWMNWILWVQFQTHRLCALQNALRRKPWSQSSGKEAGGWVWTNGSGSVWFTNEALRNAADQNRTCRLLSDGNGVIHHYFPLCVIERVSESVGSRPLGWLRLQRAPKAMGAAADKAFLLLVTDAKLWLCEVFLSLLWPGKPLPQFITSTSLP